VFEDARFDVFAAYSTRAIWSGTGTRGCDRVREAASSAPWFSACHRRLHGEIGHIPPAEYETNYYRETTKPQVTVTT
jgi:putative transposase